MEGTEQPNQEKIRMLGVKENYKYMLKLEVESIKQAKMKEKNKKRVLQINK